LVKGSVNTLEKIGKIFTINGKTEATRKRSSLCSARGGKGGKGRAGPGTTQDNASERKKRGLKSQTKGWRLKGGKGEWARNHRGPN